MFLIFLSACKNPTALKTAEKQAEVSPKLNSVKVIDDISYRQGNSKSWKLDLAMPENFGTSPPPAIVFVHGGGWCSGSKQELVYRRLLLDYAFQGYVAVSVEYRLDQELLFLHALRMLSVL